MDVTERKITKIARELSAFTVQTMKADGVGTAEFDFIHLVRHNPGITQAEICDRLRMDKGAAARRAANLEAKGYLVRRENPEDGRSKLMYATEKAESLRGFRRKNGARSAKRSKSCTSAPSMKAGQDFRM